MIAKSGHCVGQHPASLTSNTTFFTTIPSCVNISAHSNLSPAAMDHTESQLDVGDLIPRRRQEERDLVRKAVAPVTRTELDEVVRSSTTRLEELEQSLGALSKSVEYLSERIDKLDTQDAVNKRLDDSVKLLQNSVSSYVTAVNTLALGEVGGTLKRPLNYPRKFKYQSNSWS